MKTKRPIRPVRVTDLGMLCMQVRLSLRETKKDFAKRFYVHYKTVYFWETGQSLYIAGLIREALNRMANQLNDKQMLIPMEVVQLEFQKIIEKRGDADDLDVPKITRGRGRPTLQSDLELDTIMGDLKEISGIPHKDSQATLVAPGQTPQCPSSQVVDE